MIHSNINIKDINYLGGGTFDKEFANIYCTTTPSDYKDWSEVKELTMYFFLSPGLFKTIRREDSPNLVKSEEIDYFIDDIIAKLQELKRNR